MRHERLWPLGGAFCALVLVAFGYYFFIRPKHNDTESIKDQASDATVQVAKQRHELADLSRQYEHLGEYKAKLDQGRAALPPADAVPDLLRELQVAGEVTGITVSSVSVGAATDLKDVVGYQVYALPVSLNVTGPTDRVNPFLDQLQQVQPRAVLIGSVNFAPSSAAGLDRSSVTINLQAFYAPLT
jgi:Tfp pilus assembly protein PilO